MADEELPFDDEATRISSDPIDNIGSDDIEADAETAAEAPLAPEPFDVISADSLYANGDEEPGDGEEPASVDGVYHPKSRGYDLLGGLDKDKKRMLMIAGSALACGLLAVIIAIATRGGSKPAEKAPQEVVIPETVAVERADLHSELASTGTIQTDSVFAVRGEVGGTVVDVQVSEGQQVSEGTVLLTITNGELSQAAIDAQTKVERAERDLADAQAEHEQARIDLENAKKTYDTEYLAYTDALKVYEEAVAAAAYAQPPVAPTPIDVETATDEEKAAYDEAYSLYTLEQSAYEKVLENLDSMNAPKAPEIFTDDLQSKVDAAQQKVTAAQQALDTAKDELEKATSDDEKRVVKAPVAGTVVSVVDPGTVVADPTQPKPADAEEPEPLVELSNLTTITVDVVVDEKDINSIERGQLARLTFADIPDYECAARVEEIVPAGDTSENEGEEGKRHVTLVVPDADSRILPGMKVDATIVTLNEEQALVVPVNVLVMDGDTATVQVLVSEETGEVETRTVTLGENDGTRVAITDGLSEGELVVVPGK